MYEDPQLGHEGKASNNTVLGGRYSFGPWPESVLAAFVVDEKGEVPVECTEIEVLDFLVLGCG
jgi:hypothetical protein